MKNKVWRAKSRLPLRQAIAAELKMDNKYTEYTFSSHSIADISRRWERKLLVNNDRRGSRDIPRKCLYCVDSI